MSSPTSQPHLDLKTPPPLPDGGLRVMALGGLGEIGRNMAVLEFEGRLLVIDCGVLFPEAEQPGIDLILPDFGVIEHRLDDIDALVLTHGHEDHIGAVGVVSVVGHVVGPRLAELIAAVESGDLVKARAVNESLLPVYSGVMGGGQGAMMVKAALKELRLPAGPVRPPLVDATPEQVAQLREDLVAGGVHL